MRDRATQPFDEQRQPPRWAYAVLSLVGAWFAATHFAHVFTDAINWDEFALLARADWTLRFGEVVGGGRPGLVTIALIPFVENCVDSVKSVLNARLLWQFLTLAYIAGVYFLVRRWFVAAGRPDDGRVQGLVAVALLAFLPAFVTWSVQVRTDQAALAFGVWGGVMLLSAGHWRALLAGTLFGIALLCTQKALYTIGLCGLLFLTSCSTRLLAANSLKRSEIAAILGRLAVVGLGFGLVIGTYFYFVPSAAGLASGSRVASSFEAMDWVRQRQGYRIYTVHATRLVVHWALFATLVVWSVRSLIRRDRSEAPVLLTCWLVLLLGLVVARIHGVMYAYFIMTVGLFPAIALAMGCGRPLHLAGRMQWVVFVSLVALAALQSARESIEMLADTQWEQRQTMRLIHESGLRNMRGYNVESALFCARDPDPMPTMFAYDIWQRFKGSPTAADEFINEFRRRPVAYIVESYRMNKFPKEVQAFWGSHYVWHSRSLFVAGFLIPPTVGPHDVDVIVPAEYRWLPEPKGSGTSLIVGSKVVPPLGTIRLEVGQYRVAVQTNGTPGFLMLADPPAIGRDAYPAFYHLRQIMQLVGSR